MNEGVRDTRHEIIRTVIGRPKQPIHIVYSLGFAKFQLDRQKSFPVMTNSTCILTTFRREHGVNHSRPDRSPSVPEKVNFVQHITGREEINQSHQLRKYTSAAGNKPEQTDLCSGSLITCLRLGSPKDTVKKQETSNSITMPTVTYRCYVPSRSEETLTNMNTLTKSHRYVSTKSAERLSEDHKFG